MPSAFDFPLQRLIVQAAFLRLLIQTGPGEDVTQVLSKQARVMTERTPLRVKIFLLIGRYPRMTVALPFRLQSVNRCVALSRFSHDRSFPSCLRECPEHDPITEYGRWLGDTMHLSEVGRNIEFLVVEDRRSWAM